jgi:hypothetical protein
MVTKYTNIFRYNTLPNLTKLGFLVFETKPSGNPAPILEGSKIQRIDFKVKPFSKELFLPLISL